MGVTARDYYFTTDEQDFTASGEVDIRRLRIAAGPDNNTTICAHPNAAGTTQITLDPYKTRSTQGNIAANAGWSINQLGADGMESVANARRIIPAGAWQFVLVVSVPTAGAVTGTITVSAIFHVYRVSSSGARTLLFTATSSSVRSTGLAAISFDNVVANSASQPQYTLEPNETIHVGVVSNAVQVAGLLGATVAANITWAVGLSDKYVRVPAPGIRTIFDRTLSDTAPVAETLSRIVTFPRALSDSVPVADTVSRQYMGSRTLSDSAPVADTITRVATFPRLLSDSAPVTDSITRRLTANRTLSESLTPVADTLSRQYMGSRTLSDTMPVADTITRQVTYARTLLDALREGGGETTIIAPAFGTFE